MYSLGSAYGRLTGSYASTMVAKRRPPAHRQQALPLSPPTPSNLSLIISLSHSSLSSPSSQLATSLCSGFDRTTRKWAAAAKRCSIYKLLASKYLTVRRLPSWVEISAGNRDACSYVSCRCLAAMQHTSERAKPSQLLGAANDACMPTNKPPRCSLLT